MSANTAAQAYALSNPWGSTTLERRRITQSLGFSLYHLQGDVTPFGADYTARVSFRLDSDFGVNAHLPDFAAGGETDFSVANGAYYVPGVSGARLDLMYAYVEGENLADGILGFRIGRQYVSDVLGHWSFDGALFRVTTPFFVELSAYGGLEQRGGLPLSSSRYEAQGVWRGSHADFGDEPGDPANVDYPSYQFAAVAPAFGFVAESIGPNWIHGRFSYRRVYSTGDAFTRQFPDEGGGYHRISGARVSSDRLGYALNLALPEVGGIKGGFAYDLYNELVPNAFAGVDVYATDALTFGLDADYYEPTFDADSIWNWFTKEPSMTGLGRVAARIGRQFDIAASGGVKAFMTEGDPDAYAAIECERQFADEPDPNCYRNGRSFDPVISGTHEDMRDDEEARATTATFDGMGNLAARYVPGTGKIEVRSMIQAGERGRRVGGDILGEKTFDGGTYTVGGRVSLYNFYDSLRPQREATSFAYVLSGSYRPFDVARIGLEWDHAINDLVGNRFRVVALLDILWVK